MQRISTTVIGLVGEGARACAEGLARAPNIRVELPDHYLLLDPGSRTTTRAW